MPPIIALKARPVFVWRDVTLTRTQHHRGHSRFESEGRTWKVERFYENDVWYARLRLSICRACGRGASKEEALEAAYEEARALLVDLQRVLSSGVRE